MQDIWNFSRDILKGGNIGMRAGGRGVLGVYYLLENNIIIHYYYCQSEVGEGGEDSPPSPPLENTPRAQTLSVNTVFSAKITSPMVHDCKCYSQLTECSLIDVLRHC